MGTGYTFRYVPPLYSLFMNLSLISGSFDFLDLFLVLVFLISGFDLFIVLLSIQNILQPVNIQYDHCVGSISEIKIGR